MIIIPAIDVIDNKVVRLSKGEFENVRIYSDSVFKQAIIFEEIGFKKIHIVDLIASKSGNITIMNSLNEIKSKTNLKVEFGGGIRNLNNAKKIIDAGVDEIIIGSISIIDKKAFEKIVNEIGSEKIIMAADVNRENIAVKGWTETSSVNLYDHIKYCLQLGINKILCTDISRDGMLKGTNIELYKKIINKYPNLNLIASGGISNIDDVRSVNKINAYGVIVGKAIYENKIDLKELVEFDN